MRVTPVAFAVLAISALPALTEEVSVFAAASMKTALDELAAAHEAESGDNIVISYAGSNALARQIIAGAPADIFISANPGWMDEVEKAGLVADGSRLDLLGNTLVLVAHDDVPAVSITPKLDLAAMLGDEKLAMALVNSVPAGQYGKAALESLRLWEGVAPSVAQADNVRAALALVSTGEAPFGIVYASDAMADPDVHVIGTFPDDSHPPAIYPAALLTGAADQADRAFFQILSSDRADAIFAAQGFIVVN